MKPGSARRTAWFTNGHKKGHALASQRTSAIKAPICLAPFVRRVGAGLVMPFANTDAMQKHLQEISRAVSHGAIAVLLMDRAGWHTTGVLEMPKNIIPIFLPPRLPELNPVENIWQFMRDNWLSNRIFENYEAIVDACCDAWNRPIDRPWKIMSIGLRKWAHEG